MPTSPNLESKATMVPEQELSAKEPIINNEVGTNQEKASDGMNTMLLVGTETDAEAGNDVRKKLNQVPRYFNQYGENDYDSNADKVNRRRKRCYICGAIDHVGKRCRKVTPCFICSKKGHLVIKCPNKKVKEDCASTPCLKCGNKGHDMFSCTNEYDYEDLKFIECYVCKQVGHLCCVDEKTEGPREASCYKCGQSGHFGLECSKPNEVSTGLQLKCRKCRERGHSKKQCPKRAANKVGATTKAEKKVRNARRRKNTMQTPTTNLSQPNGEMWPPVVGPYHGRQPNGVWWPPIFGPYYARPGSNVWLSPAAAAARPNFSNQGGALSRQQVYHNHVGPQVVNAVCPPTGYLYQYCMPQTAAVLNWHYERRTKLLQPNAIQQTGIQVPQAESGVPEDSSGVLGPTS